MEIREGIVKRRKVKKNSEFMEKKEEKERRWRQNKKWTKEGNIIEEKGNKKEWKFNGRKKRKRNKDSTIKEEMEESKKEGI